MYETALNIQEKGGESRNNPRFGEDPKFGWKEIRLEISPLLEHGIYGLLNKNIPEKLHTYKYKNAQSQKTLDKRF